jgi:hypothetical protein
MVEIAKAIVGFNVILYDIPMNIATALATKLQARATCEKVNNAEWFAKHTQEIERIMREAPSGSGIDKGIHLVVGRSSEKQLVFSFSYHHMNDGGMYTDWTEYIAFVRPAFGGLNVAVRGENRLGLTDHLHEIFSYWLQEEYVPGA